MSFDNIVNSHYHPPPSTHPFNLSIIASHTLSHPCPKTKNYHLRKVWKVWAFKTKSRNTTQPIVKLPSCVTIKKRSPKQQKLHWRIWTKNWPRWRNNGINWLNGVIWPKKVRFIHPCIAVNSCPILCGSVFLSDLCHNPVYMYRLCTDHLMVSQERNPKFLWKMMTKTS